MPSKIEIKGRSLNEAQAAQLINLVLQYDTTVQFVALDINTHSDSMVTKFKNQQADNVTANTTREHHPGPVPHLHQLGEAVRRMPNQLFLQVVATWELIMRTIREGTLYYVRTKIIAERDPSWQMENCETQQLVLDFLSNTVTLTSTLSRSSGHCAKLQEMNDKTLKVNHKPPLKDVDVFTLVHNLGALYADEDRNVFFNKKR